MKSIYCHDEVLVMFAQANIVWKAGSLLESWTCLGRSSANLLFPTFTSGYSLEKRACVSKIDDVRCLACIFFFFPCMTTDILMR